MLPPLEQTTSQSKPYNRTARRTGAWVKDKGDVSISHIEVAIMDKGAKEKPKKGRPKKLISNPPFAKPDVT